MTLRLPRGESDAGDPLRRAAARRREGRRERDAAVRFDERRLLHLRPMYLRMHTCRQRR